MNRDDNFYVETPLIVGREELKVASLISKNGRSRNMFLLNELLLSVNMDSTLRISISMS